MKTAKFIFTYKIYSLVIFAYLINQIGNGYVKVALYYEFSKAHLSIIYFTTAFTLSILPAIFSVHYGKKISKEINYLSKLYFMQYVGAITILLLVPFVVKGYYKLLLCAEFITSLILGVSYPIIQQIIRQTFRDVDLQLAAKIDVYVSTASTILGLGLGSLLVTHIEVFYILIFSALTYILAAYILYRISFQPIQTASIISEDNKFTWKNLTFKQKRALFIMPILSIVTAPALAMLPAFGAGYDNATLNPTLIFLLARSIGQILGPLLVTPHQFKNSLRSNIFISICLSFFSLSYIYLINSNNIILSALIIIFAHILSNIVYALAFYLLQIQFNASNIAKAASIQLQYNLTITFILSIASGIISSFYHPQIVIIITLLLGLGILLILHFARDSVEGDEYN